MKHYFLIKLSQLLLGIKGRPNFKLNISFRGLIHVVDSIMNKEDRYFTNLIRSIH